MGTLRVAVGTSPLRSEHERLIRTALRRGDPSPEDVLAGARLEATYSERALRLAREAWRARMVHEHRSAAVFARLLPQLMRAEAALEYRTTVLRMGMDELRHAALCGRVVELLGGVAEAEAELATEPLPDHEDATPREAALRNVLFVGCLSETVALALLAEERELTREPAIAAVVTQLEADEVLHARLGWSYLGELAPQLTDEERARTDRYLRVAFAHLEREMHAAMPAATVDEPTRVELEALGCMLGVEGRALFAETMDAVVLPRLEDHGLAARRAWAERRA
ncbi:MAG: ferritin-like domain-containing protein [Myxococcales bacterium]|nr:ferritin-like domain-containing protein [Myxococcales bacterium]